MIEEIQNCSCDNFTIYTPKMLEKNRGMPSGLKALRGFIYFKAALISDVVNVRVNSSFMDIVTFGWIAFKISVKSSRFLEVKSFSK